VRRLDRRFEDDYAIDLDRFASLVTTKTRLAIVTNLHNPSGARIPMPTLRAMASLLARVKAYLLVDEVYLECVFRNRPESSVHAGPNVLTTSSLTKAYGLDGLRAHGFDDTAILQMTIIASWFNYINRMADALGVGRD